VTEWEVRALGDICDILDSKRKPITKRDRIAGQFPYYGASGILDYVNDYIFNEALILVGEDGAKWGAGENSSFNADGKYWVNNHAHVIRPDRKQIIDQWLIYYLNGNDLSPFITGLTVPKLNQAKLREIPVMLPPLPEQRRIVAILDEAFAGLEVMRANAEKNVHNARDLFDSYLDSIFIQNNIGWKISKLGIMCEQITDGTHISPKYVETGIPMLDSKHIGERFFIDDSAPEKFISPETDAELAKRCKPRAGDILISSRGSIGKLAIVRPKQDFNIMGNMILIRLPREFNRQFVAFYLRCQVKHLESLARGVAQKGLYLNQIRDFEIPTPPGAEQTRIGARLEALSHEFARLESLYRQKLTAIAELKQSLLHKAFSGQLTSSETLAA
jgi:type I restriction enzyme S subunit